MEALALLAIFYFLGVVFHDFIFSKIALPGKDESIEETPSTKIDIKNNRITTPQAEPFHAAYNKRRKSQWKSPQKKADIINYDEYILSEEWLNSSARLSKLVTTNGKCETCGSDKGTHVHHITYANLGKESVKDLSVLCALCHDLLHKRAGKGAGHYPLSLIQDTINT